MPRARRTIAARVRTRIAKVRTVEGRRRARAHRIVESGQQVRLRKSAGETGGPAASTAIRGRNSSTPRNSAMRRCARTDGSGRTRTVSRSRRTASRKAPDHWAPSRKATGHTATGHSAASRRAPDLWATSHTAAGRREAAPQGSGRSATGGHGSASHGSAGKAPKNRSGRQALVDPIASHGRTRNPNRAHRRAPSSRSFHPLARPNEVLVRDGHFNLAEVFRKGRDGDRSRGAVPSSS